MVQPTPSSFDIPEDERFIGIAEFRHPDNDYVLRSRLDCFVDTGDAIWAGIGIGYLGARRVDDPLDSEQVFDSEKGRYGNAEVARLDVLTDSESW